MRYQFENYVLDTRRCELYRDDVRLSLRPLAFNVLAYLLEHRDRVIPKDELFEHIWPNDYVGDAALSSCLKAIRQVVNDNGRSQRVIRTVRGHGYRFIAPVTATEETQETPSIAVPPETAPPLSQVTSLHSTAPLIGRTAELQRLSHALAKALHGERQIVFITGEAGIGKTSVLQAFIEQIETAHTVWIGQGHCIEQYGTGEAYLPILEALSRFGQSGDQAPLVDILNRFAPTWLIQMPTLLAPDTIEALNRRIMGSTPERMLREAAEAIEALTAIQPLILCLEDLHWSDHATLNLLAYLARRPGPARLLIAGTYRPSDVAVPDHPLPDIVRELQLHQQCEVLPLALLTAEHIATYLARRLSEQTPTHQTLQAVAHQLYQRTEGNPLFMLNMTDYLIEHELLARDGQEFFTESTTLTNIPSGLKPFIELRIEQLRTEDQELLEVASIAGEEFSVGAVAAALGAELRTIESQCEALVRQERFIERRAERDYPDGSVTGRYGFLHILYQEALYTRLPLTRRIELHGYLGAWEEAAYGEQAQTIAAELAMHFGRGRRYDQAIDYHQHAAEHAIRRVANQEAIQHLTMALTLLRQLPETTERDQREIALQSMIAVPFLMTKGYTAPEVEAACGRARELCRQFPQSPQLFSVLYGLMRFYSRQGNLDVGREIAEQMQALAQQVSDETLMMLAYASLGVCDTHAGDLMKAHDALTQALSRYDHSRHQDLFYQYSEPTGAVARTYLMYVSWMRGYPDQAEQHAREAVSLAEDIAHPFALTGANFFSAFSAYLCGDLQRAEYHANIALTLATDHHIVNFQALALWCYGRVRCAQGDAAEGIDHVQSGLALLRQIGYRSFIPHALMVLAQSYLQVGQIDAGLDAVTEALQMVEQNKLRACEAELYRLRGEILLARTQHRHLVDVNRSDQLDVHGCFQRALEIAVQQGAKSWELRATLSQCRLWQQQGHWDEAYRALKTTYDTFTEGFDTRDLSKTRRHYWPNWQPPKALECQRRSRLFSGLGSASPMIWYSSNHPQGRFQKNLWGARHATHYGVGHWLS